MSNHTVSQLSVVVSRHYIALTLPLGPRQVITKMMSHREGLFALVAHKRFGLQVDCSNMSSEVAHAAQHLGAVWTLDLVWRFSVIWKWFDSLAIKREKFWVVLCQFWVVSSSLSIISNNFSQKSMIMSISLTIAQNILKTGAVSLTQNQTNHTSINIKTPWTALIRENLISKLKFKYKIPSVKCRVLRCFLWRDFTYSHLTKIF